MATKPSGNKPGWNPPGGNRVEPTDGKKNTGYIPKEPLPAQHFNWLLWSISVWLAYFEELTDELNVRMGVAAGGILTPTANIYIDETYDGKVLMIDSSINNSLTAGDVLHWGIFSGDEAFFPEGADIAFDSTTMGSGSLWLVLPDPTVVEAGFKFTVKDKTGNFAKRNLTVVGGQIAFMTWQQVRIEGTGGFYESSFGPIYLEAAYGEWTFYYDGQEWYFI